VAAADSDGRPRAALPIASRVSSRQLRARAAAIALTHGRGLLEGAGAAAWRLAPLLALYLAAALLIQHGARPADDEASLLGFAHALLHGHYASVGTSSPVAYLWHGPALPMVLAPMVWLGLPLWAMRLLSGPLLLFVAVVLFERVLALRLQRRRALIGAYGLGLFIPFGYLLRSVAKEELALVLVIAAMYGITRALDSGRRHHLLLAGLALAALVYDRVEYGWVAIAMLVVALAWTVRRRGSRAPRRFLTICAIAVAGCIPWLAYTYSITGRVLYWGNSGGLSLYWTSAGRPDQHGAWHAVHTVFRDSYLTPFRPFFERVDRLPPVQRDLALQSAAMHNALSHPARYVVNVAANASRMLFAAPLGVHLSPLLIIGYSVFMVALLALAVHGGLRLRLDRRAIPRRWEAMPFMLLLGLGFAIHLLPTSDPRMLMPVIPVLVWIAAQGRSEPHTSATARPA
jgi:dolichyl-phosphate-mannose-protein mannosyltransferase